MTSKAVNAEIEGGRDHTPECIALFDTDDRLVSFNDAFWDMMSPCVGDLLTVGTTFEALLREGAKQGLYSIPDEALEAFVAARLKDHQNAPCIREHQLSDGKWVRVSEHKTHDGGKVLVQTNVTNQIESEREVTEVQALLRDALESLSDGFVLFDADDRLEMYNSAYEKMVNAVAPGSLVIGKTFEELLRLWIESDAYQLVRSERNAFFEMRLAEHRSCPSQHEHQHSDGRWLLVVEYQTNSGGTVLLQHDITKIKESELRARQLEEQLTDAIESLSEAFALFDAEDRLVLFNEKYLELLERTAEFIVPGITFEEIIRAGIECGQHPNAEGRIEEYVAERVAQHRNPTGPWEQEFEDGRWLRISEYKTASGSIAGLRSDITVQKHAEEALRASESKFSGILDIAQDAIITVDESGNVRMFNQGARDIFGYKEDEILGQSIERVIPERFRSGHLDKMMEFGASGGQSRQMSERGEIVGLHKDGSEFPADASISMLDLGYERLFNVILRDITQRKRIEREALEAKEIAEEASRTKSEFLANMSHELRTPLNAILGFSQVMTNESFGPMENEQYKEYAKDIHDSGTHLLNLINDVLDLSRIEAGVLQLVEGVVDANEVLRSTRRMVQERADRKNIIFNMSLDSSSPVISGDERAIKQVVLNLLSNSVKFTASEGSITVSSRTDPDGGVSLIVADTGIGIAPADIQKVLEPFGQVGDASTREHEGTGLGLPLSKRLVELHDATLELESEVGIGTSVRVRFPPERCANIGNG